MTDHEVTITPLAGSEVSLSNNFSDFLLDTAKLLGLVHGKDFIKSLSRSDFLEIIGEGAVILVLELIMKSLSSLESQAVREADRAFFLSILAVGSHVT